MASSSGPRKVFLPKYLAKHLRLMPERMTSAESDSKTIRFSSILRPHRIALALAFVAVLGETATDVLEPWPVKIVVDSIVQSKPLPGWLDGAVLALFGHQTFAILDFALAAVLIIAVVGSVSAYAEKYLTTSVSQW